MDFEYDLAVIGGGSGGMACAKEAGSLGAKVIMFDFVKPSPQGTTWGLGGTCVNVGCVPKKVMYNAAHVSEILKEAKEFGFTVESTSFDWNYLKKARDTYIKRLNGIYESGLDKLNIKRVNGFASFHSPDVVRVGESYFQSNNIVIAVGGAPNLLNVEGEELVIDSDGFFALEHQPRKVFND